MGDLTANFSRWELRCKCGCTLFVRRDSLLINLQELRNTINKRINVNSGTRCATHNANVGGTIESAHLGGWAVDIWSDNMFELLANAMQIFKRVGIAKRYIHVDVDPTKKQEIYWIYEED